MKLLVACDAHIFQTPDGRNWAKSIYGYQFWTRYLDVFDSVRIVARVKRIKDTEGNMLAVDGPGIEVRGIPFFQGPKELIKNYIKIQFALKDIDKDCDVALLRMPSQTASMTWKRLRHNIPLAGEIVYDPMNDVNQPSQSLLLKLIHLIISKNLSEFCLAANGVSYVTEYAIQEHYPSYSRLHGETSEHFETSYSTITLDNDVFTGPRHFFKKTSLTVFLSSVAMNSERKGEKILIKSVKLCRQKGYDVKAIIVGDGKLRKQFENFAREQGVYESVKFTGLLPSSNEVRKVMESADIFVFPTQGEGLPRGILEAMAIGMPVLSTPVGGIPEVIDEKYLFNPDDYNAFALEICRLMDNPDEMNAMSKRNYEKSKEFRNELLQKKRNQFYKKLLNLVR